VAGLTMDFLVCNAAAFCDSFARISSWKGKVNAFLETFSRFVTSAQNYHLYPTFLYSFRQFF
jgi:hypothetical protein